MRACSNNTTGRFVLDLLLLRAWQEEQAAGVLVMCML
jgi:hypothetical protein